MLQFGQGSEKACQRWYGLKQYGLWSLSLIKLDHGLEELTADHSPLNYKWLGYDVMNFWMHIMIFAAKPQEDHAATQWHKK